MTTCSNGPSLWKPSTKASQLFTQRNIEAAEEREAEGKRERERREARAKGRNRLKKWSREEWEEEGEESSDIDNQKLTTIEQEDRKEKKRRKKGGGIRKTEKNNGERGNEATVVRDWHMRQCGREGEEMWGTETKTVWMARRMTLTITAALPCLVHSATLRPCVQTLKWPSAPYVRIYLPWHTHTADIEYTKLCLGSVPSWTKKLCPLPWQCASVCSAMLLPMTSRHCTNCRSFLLKYLPDSKSQLDFWKASWSRQMWLTSYSWLGTYKKFQVKHQSGWMSVCNQVRRLLLRFYVSRF